MKEFVFHGTSKDNRRYTVVGYTDNQEKNAVNFAVALCSKHDNFCKKTGRFLASKRVLSENKYVKFLFTIDEQTDRIKFNREVKTLLYNLDWVSVYFSAFKKES